jgi:hypothetical protein
MHAGPNTTISFLFILPPAGLPHGLFSAIPSESVRRSIQRGWPLDHPIQCGLKNPASMPYDLFFQRHAESPSPTRSCCNGAISRAKPVCAPRSRGLRVISWRRVGSERSGIVGRWTPRSSRETPPPERAALSPGYEHGVNANAGTKLSVYKGTTTQPGRGLPENAESEPTNARAMINPR